MMNVNFSDTRRTPTRAPMPSQRSHRQRAHPQPPPGHPSASQGAWSVSEKKAQHGIRQGVLYGPGHMPCIYQVSQGRVLCGKISTRFLHWPDECAPQIRPGFSASPSPSPTPSRGLAPKPRGFASRLRSVVDTSQFYLRVDLPRLLAPTHI